jgi:heme/copper-type cytochrome/quinol oxidase subunit 2
MGMQVLRSIISATLAYIIVCGLYIYYHMETLLQDIYKIDLMVLGKQVLFYYVIFVAVYALLTYIIYSFRYSRAKRSLKRYYRHLKQLAAIYDIEKNNR